MFDPSTAALIRRAPPLDDLDTDNLPDQLSATYAKIVTTRLRLRSGGGGDTDELETLIADTRRLAFTNEAFVSASPGRDDRAAAASSRRQRTSLCSTHNAFSLQIPHILLSIREAFRRTSRRCSCSLPPKRRPTPGKWRNG